MDAALRWLGWLDQHDGRILWSRASGCRSKNIVHERGIGRTTAGRIDSPLTEKRNVVQRAVVALWSETHGDYHDRTRRYGESSLASQRRMRWRCAPLEVRGIDATDRPRN
jgi:hypothetical protein